MQQPLRLQRARRLDRRSIVSPAMNRLAKLRLVARPYFDARRFSSALRESA